jgi:ferredoxin
MSTANGQDEAAGDLEVRVDAERCMGSGNCVYWAPATFDMADEGYAVVTDSAATDLETLRTAIEGCPTGAISLWRGGAEVQPGEGA